MSCSQPAALPPGRLRGPSSLRLPLIHLPRRPWRPLPEWGQVWRRAWRDPRAPRAPGGAYLAGRDENRELMPRKRLHGVSGWSKTPVQPPAPHSAPPAGPSCSPCLWLWGHARRCSGLIPGLVLRGLSGQGSGDPRERQKEPNPPCGCQGPREADSATGSQRPGSFRAGDTVPTRCRVRKGLSGPFNLSAAGREIPPFPRHPRRPPSFPLLPLSVRICRRVWVANGTSPGHWVPWPQAPLTLQAAQGLRCPPSIAAPLTLATLPLSTSPCCPCQRPLQPPAGPYWGCSGRKPLAVQWLCGVLSPRLRCFRSRTPGRRRGLGFAWVP